jgi:response regulator RpfG family c-di-GMP phosphodiesterase
MLGTVVVVDDEPLMCIYIAEVLEDAGYICETFSNSLAALERIVSGGLQPDLIFSDIGMPGMDGIELLRSVGDADSTAPFVLLSGRYERGLAIDALKLGAADYLYKPVRPADVLAMARKHCVASDGQREAIGAALENYLQAGDVGQRASLEELLLMLGTLGLKRVETHQHALRVARYAELIGEACGLDDDQLRTLRIGSTIHDIGKILIPYNLLMKPGKLDDREWVVMKLHAQLGWELVRPFVELQQPAEIVLCHHEQFTGGGYPRGLQGTDIPLGARVFSVADTLDAILSDRPYRQGQSIDVARSVIAENSGTQFDPEVACAFGNIPDDDLLRIHTEVPDRE